MTTDSRYHALDSLRATMMLLGIYLHVVVGYSGQVGDWPYADRHPTAALDLTLGVIHVFRMPAFYALAGFFGALLWARRGPVAFVRNRLSRIVAPLLVFWPVLYAAVFTLAVGYRLGWDHVAPAWSSGAWLRRAQPMHLWFLEYLAILYVGGGAVAGIGRQLPVAMGHRMLAAFRWVLRQPYAAVACALLSWLPVAAMQGNLKVSTGWRPDVVLLTAYAVPFAFGWLLYHARDLLPRFERHVWVHLALAAPAFLVFVAVPGAQHPFVRAAGNVLTCWFVTFALIGLFMRHASAASPLGRYLSDASYWMYLVHMPLVVALQFAFRDVPWPVFAKIPAILAIATAILLGSYDTMVRPTFIGAFLNSRRFARGLPAGRPEFGGRSPEPGVRSLEPGA